MIPIGLAPAAGAPPAAVATAAPEAAEAAAPAAPFALLLAAACERRPRRPSPWRPGPGRRAAPPRPLRGQRRRRLPIGAFLALAAAPGRAALPRRRRRRPFRRTALPFACLRCRPTGRGSGGLPGRHASAALALPGRPAPRSPAPPRPSLPFASAPPAGAWPAGAPAGSRGRSRDRRPAAPIRPRGGGGPPALLRVQLRPADTAACLRRRPPCRRRRQAVGAPALRFRLASRTAAAGQGAAHRRRRGMPPPPPWRSRPGRARTQASLGRPLRCCQAGRPARGLSPLRRRKGRDVSAAVARFVAAARACGRGSRPQRRGHAGGAGRHACRAPVRRPPPQDSMRCRPSPRPPEQRANRPSRRCRGGRSLPTRSCRVRCLACDGGAGPASCCPRRRGRDSRPWRAALPPPRRRWRICTSPTPRAQKGRASNCGWSRLAWGRWKWRWRRQAVGRNGTSAPSVRTCCAPWPRTALPCSAPCARPASPRRRLLRLPGAAGPPRRGEERLPPRSAATLRPEAPPQRLATSLLDIRI